MRHDAAAEPAFIAGQQQRTDRGPQDVRLAPMMPPGRNHGGQDEEAHRHTQQPVEVLGPHQGGVELIRRELRGQRLDRHRGNPRAEAPRPVGTPETGPRGPHEAANQNQRIGQRRGPQRQSHEGGACRASHHVSIIPRPGSCPQGASPWKRLPCRVPPAVVSSCTAVPAQGPGGLIARGPAQGSRQARVSSRRPAVRSAGRSMGRDARVGWRSRTSTSSD